MSAGKGELILYRTEVGLADIQLRAIDGTVWLNQAEIAVTGQTAPELIVSRSDAAADTMGLTHWLGDCIRKADALISKNYLRSDELDQLNRLVTRFLDFAEDRALRRIETRMGEWIAQADRFLAFDERQILQNAGRVSHDAMEEIVSDRFAVFDARRRTEERRLDDPESHADMAQLESELARVVARKGTDP